MAFVLASKVELARSKSWTRRASSFSLSRARCSSEPESSWSCAIAPSMLAETSAVPLSADVLEFWECLGVFGSVWECLGVFEEC